MGAQPKEVGKHYEHKANHLRISFNHEFDYSNEPEIRLKDVIGEDQISFGSDSEELAEYSPRSGGSKTFLIENTAHSRPQNENNMPRIIDTKDLKEEANSRKE